MLNNYFPRIFVINLLRRGDRKIEFLRHSHKYVKASTFVSAIDGRDITFENPNNLDHFSAGDVGCVLSHLKTVSLAKNLEIPFYLVLEDDVKFHDSFGAFPEFWKEVPEDWDLVYFGANHNGTNPPQVMDKIVKVNGSFTTHAMVVKSTMYDALIELWSKPVAQVDVLLSSLHSKFNCYCFTPNLVGQMPGFSDILNKEVNYDHFLDN